MSFMKKLVKGAKSVLGDSTDGFERGSGVYDDAYNRGSAVEGYGQTFVHGILIIHVREARNIPDMENWYSKIYDKKDVTDPFVDVKLGQARIAKTSIIYNDLNPEWNEVFRVEVCHKADLLVFDVRDKDHAYTEEIGLVEINTQHLLNGQVLDGWFPIQKNSKENGSLHIRVEFQSMVAIAQSYEVDSYFRMQRACGVRLYQDTTCPTDLPWLNMVRGPNDKLPTYHSCWKDLYYSILGANTIICITGWSVWTELMLFRGEEAQSIYNGTLGELLCRKADEGVEVKVMVWSEKTSGDIVGDKGMMNTHDMETYKYFKDGKKYRGNNRVICALAPRELATSNELTDVLQNQFSSGMYTHHQKMVVCDAEDPYAPDGRRKLVAYVGGLDLTGGRYDSPEHNLFSTLKTDHLGDFRNSNAKETPPTVGPREPWHDIHSRVEGPIAKDVLVNFIERWSKQGRKESMPPQMDHIFLSKINPDAVAINSDPAEEWNVQLFRSITSDSADLNTESCGRLVLTSKKGRKVEQSITQAYIQTIRNAQNFIYIENQYFMGSAFEWSDDNGTNCNHTIPVEIATKIVNKMHAGERFTAYIVIPMWPEGDPTSAPMQAILYWQTRTIQMMYREIGRALVAANVPAHLGQDPTDWLVFLCPAKRELYGSYIDVLDAPPPNSLAETFRQTMRQMIYVHSKMLIVDDAYIIVGSANINERSMSGTRDTEMAVGCWQPQFSHFNPYGDVHMFRMGLWAEHLKTWEELFRFPGTLECTKRIKDMCWYNWQSYNYEKYNLPQNQLPPGQLVLYPIQVESNGRINNLPHFTSFPDYPPNAKVFGSKSAVIPEKVTT